MYHSCTSKTTSIIKTIKGARPLPTLLLEEGDCAPIFVQKCHNVIFCGLTYSYENYHQALRRIYRFGQKHTVYSYIVLGTTEMHILETVNKKKELQYNLKNQMDLSVQEIQLLNFEEREVKSNLIQNTIELPSFI